MHTIIATKQEGEVILDPANRELLDLFLRTIPEGGKLNITYELITDDKSYAQLSKVHKCIRDLATFTGHTFPEIKAEIKRETGLMNADGTFKSFADCSKDEISEAIKTAITMGERIGLNLY